MSTKKTYEPVSWYDKFLLYPDMGRNNFLQKKAIIAAQLYVLVLTALAWALNIPVFKWYGSGLMLTGIASILLYNRIRQKNIEFIPFAGMLLALVLTSIAMLRLGTIWNSGGLILVGPVLIILSLIFRNRSWTLLLAGTYVLSLLPVILMQAGAKSEPVLSDFYNAVFLTANILFLSGLILTLAQVLYTFKSKTEDIVNTGMNLEQKKNQVRADFFNTLENNFKQPLEKILENTHVLMDKNSGNSESQLLEIQTSSQEVLNMLEQIKDLLKIETGNIQQKNYQSDLIGFIRNTSNSFEKHASIKQQKLIFSSNSRQYNLDFDPRHFHRIISLLISKAIADSDKQAEIAISVNKEKENSFKDLMEVLISYKSEAMSPDLIKLINDESHSSRFAAKENIQDEITCLLASKLVRLQGGRIFVRSSKDKGTRFRIHLPVQNAAPLIALNELAKDLNMNLTYRPEQAEVLTNNSSTLSPTTSVHSKPSAS